MCDKCKSKDIARYYIKGVLPKFAAPYLINPPIKKPTKEICEFSGEEYITDMLFEDYGFTKKVSPNLLKVSEVNIKLCNENLQPIWRKRISG